MTLVEEIALMLPSPMGSDTPIALAERIIDKVREYDRAQVLSTIDGMIDDQEAQDAQSSVSRSMDRQADT